MTIRFRAAEADELVDDERAAQRICMGSAMTMDSGTLLQQQLPLHNDYALASDSECLDQFSGHAHHASYNSNGTVEPLRRDTSLVQQSPGAFAYNTTTGNTPGPRYVPSRNVAPDGRSYPTTQNFTDSGSGSLSTSPSSAASSLAYNTYQQANQYTAGISTYPGPVPHPQTFVQQSYAATRVPSILDASTQGVLPPPNRSPLSGLANAADRDLYTNSSPYLARNQLSPGTQASYPNYADSSRVLSGLSLSGLPNSYAPHMAASNAHSYSSATSESLNFPWPTLEVLLELNCEGVPVTSEVHAKVEKGFFLSTVDEKWTCYRRNYFSVNCNFELHPNINNGRLTIKRNGKTEHVMATGMRLSAAVDGSAGKSIELVQHTPKRDNGPKSKIDVTKVSPSSSGRQDSTVSPHGVYQIPVPTYHATGHPPGPSLPFQNKSDDGSPIQTDVTPTSHYGLGIPGAAHVQIPGSSTNHTFERVQFKQATANNGKRRASQQYFHLVVELFVDIRKTEQDAPSWVKVAQRLSEKIVVRGRSPSHYANEGQSGQAGRGGATGPNGGYSTGGAMYGGMNTGGFRSSGSHYSGSVSGGSNGYRSNHYGMNMSTYNPPGSHSGSSSSSIDGGPTDGYQQVDSVMSDADRLAIHEHDGYQYYPSTIYEGMALPPLGKIESNARYSTEPRQYATYPVKAEYSDAVPGAQWTANTMGRFQGVETSRGYYPDLQTGCN